MDKPPKSTLLGHVCASALYPEQRSQGHLSPDHLPDRPQTGPLSFSPYWSALVHNRPDRLRSNIIIATLLGHLPFFFFPFIDNPWFVVAAGGIFLMLKRGIIPAWMEILKRNLPEGKRHRTFSYGSILSNGGAALLPILFGRWMDIEPGIWRIIFPMTALLSFIATLFLLLIPTTKAPLEKIPFDMKAALLRPWKNSWQLLKTRPDFTHYQIGFMLGGSGLMLMQPALPEFFMKELALSYTALAAAIAACKGIGFALTSNIWARWMDRLNIYHFSALVTVLAALFPVLLLCAKFQISWIYIAYLIYGVMQAGSELSWHLSGPLFARQEDSSVYSSVNVVTVGLRGLFVPFCGTLLCTSFGSTPALVLGGVLCIMASIQLVASKRSQSLLAIKVK